MKVFFDTNVYISEALHGVAAVQALEGTKRANWRIYYNSHVRIELHRNLREKLKVPAALMRAALGRLSFDAVEVGTPDSRHRVPADPADGPILRAAMGAGVDYLVTGDKHLLSLDPYEGLRIVSLSAYRQILIDQGWITSSDS